MLGIITKIDKKVDYIAQILSATDPLVPRIERIESALFSGSGAGIIMTSASIAEVLSSTNFATGVSGWRINKAGNIEANNIVARGTIYASAGSFTGGITIGVGGSLSSGQTAYNTGTGFWLEYNGGTPRFSLGVSGGAGLTWDGSALAISGAITATSGTITGTLYVGAAANRIVIDGSAKVIRSEDFVTKVSGWQTDYLGNAEFNNILARGSISSTVFTYNEVNATAGQRITSPSAGVLYADVTTVASPTTFNVDIADPESGHYQSFAASDILRITKAGTTNWLTVSSVSDQTTFYRYVCTLSSGSATTFRKGTAVVDYGQSGDGLIVEDAQSATGPYIQVLTHAGSPWATTTERVRIGNLNGWGGFATDIYGFALGDYAGGSYMSYDTTSNVTTVANGAGSVFLNQYGMTLGVSVPGTLESPNYIKWSSAPSSPPQSSNTRVSLVGYESANKAYAFLYSIGKAQTTGKAKTVLGVYDWWADSVNYGDLTIDVDPGNTNVSDALLRLVGTNARFRVSAGGSVVLTATSSGLTAKTAGATIDEFSTDGTLAGNSDTVLPTEKAVKTAIDTWTTWTPTVTQSGSVTVDINDARYKITGHLVHVEINLTVTGSGTGANAIVIGGQPAAIQGSTGDVLGMGHITDFGVTTYTGALYVNGATDWRVIEVVTHNYIGVDPNFALASGDVIRFKADYYKA